MITRTSSRRRRRLRARASPRTCARSSARRRSEPGLARSTSRTSLAHSNLCPSKRSAISRAHRHIALAGSWSTCLPRVVSRGKMNGRSFLLPAFVARSFSLIHCTSGFSELRIVWLPCITSCVSPVSTQYTSSSFACDIL